MKLLIQQSVAEQYSDDRLLMMSHFVKYCIRALGIDEDVKVYLVDDRKKHSIKTTGSFMKESQELFVYSKKRAFVDVLRSISHELVHVRQHQDEFDKKHNLLHFDSELEDEANMYGMALVNAYSEVMGHDLVYEN